MIRVFILSVIFCNLTSCKEYAQQKEKDISDTSGSTEIIPPTSIEPFIRFDQGNTGYDLDYIFLNSGTPDTLTYTAYFSKNISSNQRCFLVLSSLIFEDFSKLTREEILEKSAHSWPNGKSLDTLNELTNKTINNVHFKFWESKNNRSTTYKSTYVLKTSREGVAAVILTEAFIYEENTDSFSMTEMSRVLKQCTFFNKNDIDSIKALAHKKCVLRLDSMPLNYRFEYQVKEGSKTTTYWTYDADSVPKRFKNSEFFPFIPTFKGAIQFDGTEDYRLEYILFTDQGKAKTNLKEGVILFSDTTKGKILHIGAASFIHKETDVSTMVNFKISYVSQGTPF